MDRRTCIPLFTPLRNEDPMNSTFFTTTFLYFAWTKSIRRHLHRIQACEFPSHLNTHAARRRWIWNLLLNNGMLNWLDFQLYFENICENTSKEDIPHLPYRQKYPWYDRPFKVKTLTTRDCKGPQTNMSKNVGSIKTWSLFSVRDINLTLGLLLP